MRVLSFMRFFLPVIKPVFFWLPYSLLCYGLVFTSFIRLGRLRFPHHLGVYWMAVFVYLLMAFAAFDIVRLIIRLCAKNILTPQFNAIGTGAAICLCIIMIFFGALHARSIKTVNYGVNLQGYGNNLRIALVSDLHIGSTVNSSWVSRVVDAINGSKPDIVCIAGDVFDGNVNNISGLPLIIAQLKRIDAPLGVYACLGNHDVDRFSLSMGAGNEKITGALQEANITVLEDEVRPVGGVYLAGRRDARPIGGAGGKNLRKTAAELLAGFEGRPLIVMDHQPVQFAQIEQAGAGLMLSGHTHKGQLFPANFITGMIFKKAGAAHYGHFRGGAAQAVITSGAGVWGPPLRVGTKSEVAVIDITFSGGEPRAADAVDAVDAADAAQRDDAVDAAAQQKE